MFAAVRIRRPPCDVNVMIHKHDVAVLPPPASASQPSLRVASSSDHLAPPSSRNSNGASASKVAKGQHPIAPSSLSTFRTDSALLSQCALSLAADLPSAPAATTAAAAAIAAADCASWSNDASRNRMSAPGLDAAAVVHPVAPTTYHRGIIGPSPSRPLPSQCNPCGLQVVNGHLPTSPNKRVADV